MTAEPISISEFRADAEEAGRILASYGFRRAPQLDSESPTTASVVFAGQNIAFEFTLDIRDGGLDLVVTRYRDGRLLTTLDGGYSSSLYTYLLNRCGFRGRPVPAVELPRTSRRTMRVFSALVNLLTEPCAQSLLSDQPASLPPQ